MTPLKQILKRGDWVKFCREDRIVIGEVEYVSFDESSPLIATSAGELDESRLLEIRQAGDESGLLWHRSDVMDNVNALVA